VPKVLTLSVITVYYSVAFFT